MNRRGMVAFILLAGLSRGGLVTPEGLEWPVRDAPVSLARAGRALLPVVISLRASETIRARANELTNLLHRITGATVAIQERGEAAGITLGTLEQFPIPHAWHRIPAAAPAAFASHPESFALVAGERRPPQFCVTQPVGRPAGAVLGARRHQRRHDGPGSRHRRRTGGSQAGRGP